MQFAGGWAEFKHPLSFADVINLRDRVTRNARGLLTPPTTERDFRT